MASARKRAAGSLRMSTMAGPGPSTSRGRTVPSVAELQAESIRDDIRVPLGVPEEEDSDRAEDGGIGSRLGESYADDVKMRNGKLVVETPEPRLAESTTGDLQDAEELANGGVLGLLAQIYDRRRGPMM